MKSSASWTWLFPVTYVIHAGEEFFAGERFYNWISRVAGANLSREDFLTINAVSLTSMTLAVLAINTVPGARFLMATFGFIVALNGSLHTVSTIVTQSYSPGLVSGLLVWIPLGVFALQRARRELTQAELSLGVALGVLIHAMVILVALNV
jgi:hypothetical protein